MNLKLSFKQKILAGLIFGVGVLASGLLGQGIVSALDYDYFDSSPSGSCDIWNRTGTSAICDSANVRLSVGETQYVRKSGVYAVAYFTGDRGKVEIRGANWCWGEGSDNLETEDWFGSHSIANGTNVTKYTAVGRDRNSGAVKTWTSYGKKYSSGNSRCDDKIIFDFGPGDLLRDARTGLYKAEINVDHVDLRTNVGGICSIGDRDCDGLQNRFYMQETGPGRYAIAQKGGTTGYEVTMQETSGPDFITYVARFGSSCAVDGHTAYNLYFYDMDNAGGGGAQPVGNPVVMDLIDRDTGDFVRATDGDLLKDYEPPTNNNAVGYKAFIPQPGARYIWKLKNVYKNNDIQFSTPFDGIYYMKPCTASPYLNEFTPIIEKNLPAEDTIPNGEPYKFTFKVKNEALIAGTVKYDWSIRSGDDPGDSVIGGSGTDVSGPGAINGGSTVELTTRTGTANLAQGSQICAHLTIKWDQAGSPKTKTANPVCIAIGKRPLVQVLGGDLWAGGDFKDLVTGSCDSLAPEITGSAYKYSDGTKVGSWGEYGVFGLGSIDTFGSAAQPYISPAGLRLTFANTGAGSPGNFANPDSHCLTDYFAKYQPLATPQPGNININAVDGIKSTGSVTISAPASYKVPAGKTLVVVANGNVTIASNIQYTDSVPSVDQIPKVIILATGRIIINDNVTRVDAILSAKGKIYTCYTNPRLSSDCDQPLTLNGAIITPQLVLRRTFGADRPNASTDRRNTPAETLNLRPDFLLTPPSPTTVLITTDERELPPRY